MDRLEAALTARDWIDVLVDAQLANHPRPQFSCHKCGPVYAFDPCGDPYPHCPKAWMVPNCSV